MAVGMGQENFAYQIHHETSEGLFGMASAGISIESSEQMLKIVYSGALVVVELGAEPQRQRPTKWFSDALYRGKSE